MCTLNKCYSADVLSDVYAFTSSSFYMSPPDGDQQSYMDYIRNLPQTGGAGKGGRAEKAWEGYFVVGGVGVGGKGNMCWEERRSLTLTLTRLIPVCPPLHSRPSSLPAPIMPLTDSPEVFGLHSNAAITFQLQEGRKMVETVLSIQPRVAAGGSGSGKAMTEEDIVLEVI